MVRADKAVKRKEELIQNAEAELRSLQLQHQMAIDKANESKECHQQAIKALYQYNHPHAPPAARELTPELQQYGQILECQNASMLAEGKAIQEQRDQLMAGYTTMQANLQLLLKHCTLQTIAAPNMEYASQQADATQEQRAAGIATPTQTGADDFIEAAKKNLADVNATRAKHANALRETNAGGVKQGAAIIKKTGGGQGLQGVQGGRGNNQYIGQHFGIIAGVRLQALRMNPPPACATGRYILDNVSGTIQAQCPAGCAIGIMSSDTPIVHCYKTVVHSLHCNTRVWCTTQPLGSPMPILVLHHEAAVLDAYYP